MVAAAIALLAIGFGAGWMARRWWIRRRFKQAIGEKNVASYLDSLRPHL